MDDHGSRTFMMYNRTNHDFVTYPKTRNSVCTVSFSLMGMRDRAGMTTHKKASPILPSSLSLSLFLIPPPSSPSAAMNCCSNGLCAFFLRIWTRERASERTKRWRNERERVAGSLSNQTEGGRPTGSSGATVPVACRARLLGL